MSQYRDNIEKLFGAQKMGQSPSRKELYDAVEMLMEAHNRLVDRLSALEGNGKKSKPRVRVPAGSERNA